MYTATSYVHSPFYKIVLHLLNAINCKCNDKQLTKNNKILSKHYTRQETLFRAKSRENMSISFWGKTKCIRACSANNITYCMQYYKMLRESDNGFNENKFKLIWRQPSVLLNFRPWYGCMFYMWQCTQQFHIAF